MWMDRFFNGFLTYYGINFLCFLHDSGMHLSVSDLGRIWYRFSLDFRHPWSCEKTILTLYSLQKARNWQFRSRIRFSQISSIDFTRFVHTCFMFFPHFSDIDCHIDFWEDFGWHFGHLRQSLRQKRHLASSDREQNAEKMVSRGLPWPRSSL